MQKFLFLLAVQITIFFSIAFGIAIFSNYLIQINFFQETDSQKYINQTLNENYIWSKQHYIYFWFTFCMFILGIVRIIWWSWYNFNSFNDLYINHNGIIHKVLGEKLGVLTIKNELTKEIKNITANYPVYIKKENLK